MSRISIIPRFGETDALGHVNNASYFSYLEEARIRFFEEIGYNISSKEWNFILASTKCDFVNQGYFNQQMTINTYVSRIGTKSFQLEHDIICSQTGEIIAKANAIIVYFDFEKQKSAPIPGLLKEGLKSYLAH
ncbi:acyl-CoA thioesterase [Bacillus massilinigeriensis]|uniref:acyl-CoA thioesterase n=1 Tax=Bacillus massilionigeriensis TaxID=1805475 RepID=UPI00096B35AA|nr:thioesterase family protein [Bacillus massilionigeriensis]